MTKGDDSDIDNDSKNDKCHYDDNDDSDNDNDNKNDKCHYDDNDDKDNDNDHWKWQDSTHSYLFSAEKRKKFVKTFLVVLFSWQWKAEVRRIKSGRSKKGETLCTLKLEKKTNFL